MTQGFSFNESSYNFQGSCALLLSHSGATFGTLNVSNLLKGFTPHLFVVTSDWDTQIARSARSGMSARLGAGFDIKSYVFITFCGIRPAEPVSLTAVAMHQLLTQVLLYLMYAARYYFPHLPTLGGSTFTIEEVQELETLNLSAIAELNAIVTDDVSPVRQELIAQGRYWSRHILEGPISWMMSAVYIAATIIAGTPPLTGLAMAINRESTPSCTAVLAGTTGQTTAADIIAILSVGNESVAVSCESAMGLPYRLQHLVGFVDAALYIFLPIWTTWILRLCQGRPWLHRVASRSLLIGDVPWVAQTLEAFVSKTFALAYSVATINVASANPLDHLLHRHTHRLVRGSLLAIGRPDGRLNAHTSAENTICLAVKQASSIQTFGATCESFTLGHNPFNLQLSASIHLPTKRPDFMSEYALHLYLQRPGVRRDIRDAGALTSASLLGILSRLDAKAFEGLMPPDVDHTRPEFIKSIEPLWGKGAHSQEQFIGAWMATDRRYKSLSTAELMLKQSQMQEIYEGRIASMQRFVGFLVTFHAMGKAVQDFWSMVSLGILGYDMSRTQSILRIASTASPVSGNDVRKKMLEIEVQTAKQFCATIIAMHWRKNRHRRWQKKQRMLKAMDIGKETGLLRSRTAGHLLPIV